MKKQTNLTTFSYRTSTLFERQYVSKAFFIRCLNAVIWRELTERTVLLAGHFVSLKLSEEIILNVEMASSSNLSTNIPQATHYIEQQSCAVTARWMQWNILKLAMGTLFLFFYVMSFNSIEKSGE